MINKLASTCKLVHTGIRLTPQNYKSLNVWLTQFLEKYLSKLFGLSKIFFFPNQQTLLGTKVNEKPNIYMKSLLLMGMVADTDQSCSLVEASCA